MKYLEYLTMMLHITHFGYLQGQLPATNAFKPLISVIGVASWNMDHGFPSNKQGTQPIRTSNTT